MALKILLPIHLSVPAYQTKGRHTQ